MSICLREVLEIESKDLEDYLAYFSIIFLWYFLDHIF